MKTKVINEIDFKLKQQLVWAWVAVFNNLIESGKGDDVDSMCYAIMCATQNMCPDAKKVLKWKWKGTYPKGWDQDRWDKAEQEFVDIMSYSILQ